MVASHLSIGSVPPSRASKKFAEARSARPARRDVRVDALRLRRSHVCMGRQVSSRSKIGVILRQPCGSSSSSSSSAGVRVHIRTARWKFHRGYTRFGQQAQELGRKQRIAILDEATLALQNPVFRIRQVAPDLAHPQLGRLRGDAGGLKLVVRSEAHIVRYMKTHQAKRDAAHLKDGGEPSSEDLLETPELARGVSWLA